MSKTETTTTAYGEVEYKTVDCDSCGNTFPREECRRFVIGDYYGKDTWNHKGDELEFKRYNLGYCCPYCEDDPAGFPQTRIGGWYMDLPWLLQVGLGLGTVVLSAVGFLATLSIILQ